MTTATEITIALDAASDLANAGMCDVSADDFGDVYRNAAEHLAAELNIEINVVDVEYGTPEHHAIEQAIPEAYGWLWQAIHDATVA